MKNVYTIDLNTLFENEISIIQALTLISLQDIDIDIDVNEIDIKKLEEKGFINIIIEENEKIEVIKKKGRVLIEKLKKENIQISNNKRTPKRNLIHNEQDDEFITNFRELWKGLKPGAMGSQNGCKIKMYKWMNENPEYKKEDIFKAAKTYLKSVNDYRFLQAADYFIYKKDAHGESSRLSAFIDEADTPNDEWSSQLS